MKFRYSEVMPDCHHIVSRPISPEGVKLWMKGSIIKRKITLDPQRHTGNLEIATMIYGNITEVEGMAKLT